MTFNPNDHLIDLKGKDYLQVMWRLVWFREEKPLWTINTILIKLENDHAVFKAEILNEEGRQIASGYGSEGIKDFRDFIEKAETKAIGRALAMLGYGTQFAPELDEGERIVDSPKPKRQAKSGSFQNGNNATDGKCAVCGEAISPAVVTFSTKKYGKPLCIRHQKEQNV
jgi:hypothetical protein